MWAVVVFLINVPAIFASNILVVVPLPVSSHSLIFHSLVKALAEKGHNVTYLSNLLISGEIRNVTQVKLPMDHAASLDAAEIDLFGLRFQSPIKQIISANNYGIIVSDHQLGSTAMQALLASDSEFDLTITQAMLSDSVTAGLAHRFKAPTMVLSNLQPNLWNNHLVGNMAPTSYTAHPILGLPTKMTFLQRTINFVCDSLGNLHLHWIALPKHNEILKKYFGNKVPPILDILKNTSLVIANDHFSLTYPRPLVPNMVLIGGAHVAPSKALPPDLDEYMNSSKHGVVLFSMGTILKGSAMSKEKIEIFFQVFSKLKQNVLWKFEKDLQGTPDNVLISKWLPQNDILAHPNLKLFITHGGISSCIEAVHHGVPLVGIPVFADQPINMKNVVHTGTGLSIDYDQLSTEGLYAVIQEVLNNPKYRENAKLRSKQLNDQPMSPLKTAVWWIEYVIRHKGASHLRSAAQELNFYQLYQIDVFCFLLTTIVIIFCAAWKIFSLIFRLVKRRFSDKRLKRD